MRFFVYHNYMLFCNLEFDLKMETLASETTAVRQDWKKAQGRSIYSILVVLSDLEATEV